MYEKIKEIMKLSFHNDFFIDRINMDSNYEYLYSLVDIVLSNENSNDLEYIANNICFLDKRIRNMFIPSIDIMSLCLKNLNIDFFDFEYSRQNILTIEEIKKIYRNSYSENDFKKKLKISTMFISFENLTPTQKKDIIANVSLYLKNEYGITISRNTIYKVKPLEENGLTLAVNEVIYWLATQMGFIFSHQTCFAIELLKEYDKMEMYYDVNKVLAERKYSIIEKNIPDNIVNKVLGASIPNYDVSEVDYVFYDLSEEEKSLFNAYVYIQDEYCKYIHYSIKEKKRINLELIKINEIAIKRQLKIDELNKIIAEINHQCESNKNESINNMNKYEKQLDSMKKELFSLREYIFNKSLYDESNDINVYEGDYKEVAIVGGHQEWHKKVREKMKGINIIHTDQNIIDWSFLNHIKVIVVVTNYISHSMYYRLIDNLNNQKLLYLQYKNIERFKKELDSVLLKIEN